MILVKSIDLAKVNKAAANQEKSNTARIYNYTIQLQYLNRKSTQAKITYVAKYEQLMFRQFYVAAVGVAN